MISVHITIVFKGHRTIITRLNIIVRIYLSWYEIKKTKSVIVGLVPTSTHYWRVALSTEL